MTNYHIGPDDPDASRGAGSFERWLAEAAPTLNDPPATPREEMWAEMVGSGALRVGRGARGPRSRAWIFPAALAAAAVMGIVIDRAFMREREAGAPAPQVAQRVASACSYRRVRRNLPSHGGRARCVCSRQWIAW